jgi:predicted Zn-dependent protease
LKAERYDSCIRHAERALALTPHWNETPIRATLGEAYLAAGRPREAIAPLETATRDHPGDQRVRRLLARARELSR